MTDKKTRDEEVAQARRYMAMPLTKAAMDRARGHWVPWLIEALDEAEAERDALKAKLAALVAACEMALDIDSEDVPGDAFHDKWKGAPGYGNGDGSREILSKALASAKVQP